jgi:hypothetical protein
MGPWRGARAGEPPRARQRSLVVWRTPARLLVGSVCHLAVVRAAGPGENAATSSPLAGARGWGLGLDLGEWMELQCYALSSEATGLGNQAWLGDWTGCGTSGPAASCPRWLRRGPNATRPRSPAADILGWSAYDVFLENYLANFPPKQASCSFSAAQPTRQAHQPHRHVQLQALLRASGPLLTSAPCPPLHEAAGAVQPGVCQPAA